MKNTKLKNAREKRGLTQAQIASAVGITEVGYQNYECGRREPSIRIAIKIAKELKVPVEDLFSE